MQSKALVIALVLCGSSLPAAGAEDSLVLQAGVRYRAAGPQQPAGRRRAVGGRPERLQTGDTVRVSLTDRDQPFDIITGLVRIRSFSTGYDSGEQRLVHEQDGRSVYFQWRTSKLAPARDYRIETVVQTKSGGTKSRRIDLALHPVIVEQTVLERTTDLALPYWSLGLHLTRRFRYESTYGIYRGPLGHGWTHAYGVLLSEDTDGSLSFFDTATGGAGYYRPLTPGSYESAAGDDSRLTRDPNGVFHLRLANGNLWRFHSNLKPAFLQDPRGRRVSFEHDAAGRLIAAVDGSGQRIDFTYDGESRIVAATDSTGRRVTYGYDPQGNLDQARDAAGALTRYRYDSRHRLLEIVFADGRTRSFAYGDYGRLSRSAESGGAGNVTFTYNVDNPTHGERTITDAAGRSIRELSYGDGFLVETRDTLVNTVSQVYDAGFHRSRFVDANGNAWTFVTDVDKGRYESSDPLGHTTSIRYSPDDRQITAAIDGHGRETRFSYAGGELETTTFPDAVSERRRVTREGSFLIEERIRRNGLANRYVFDSRGLLLNKLLHDGSAWTYTYDARGNLTRATNEAGTIRMSYDLRDRLIRTVHPGARVFTYDYDERSRLVKMVNPDGEALAYTFDEPGRLQSIVHGGALVARYEYNPAMQPVRRILGNGVTTELAYDGAGRLTRVAHAGISAWDYTLDANGRRTAKTSGDGAETYQFDAAGELIRAGYPDGSTEAFAYDAVGNRTAATTGVLNQYTAIGDQTLAWDPNGNLSAWTSTAGTTRYSWIRKTG